MKDGILYSNILLKLYLKSLKNGDVYKRQVNKLGFCDSSSVGAFGALKTLLTLLAPVAFI